LFSQYPANSVRTAWSVLIAALVYYAVRLTVQRGPAAALLSGLLGLGGAWLAFTGLGQFQAQVRQLANVGLTDLIAFRSRLMSPPGQWVLGEWLTLLLLALPFACALAIWFWQTGRNRVAAIAVAPALAIAAALTLCCSRAVFWSMVLFCVMTCGFMAAGRIIRFRTAGLVLVSVLAVLGLIFATECALYPSVLEAYAGRHTSQVRSTEGRIGIWKRSADVVRAHPLWGVGSSNAALALTATGEQEDTSGFASRTFSLPIQVLVEKGAIVFLVYCAFVVLVGREFVRTLRSGAAPANKAMACCFAAGLVAVLARELTYSSLFEHTVTLALAAMLAALVVGPDGVPVSQAAVRDSRRQAEAPAPRAGGRGMKAVALLLAGAVVVLYFVMGDYDQEDAKLQAFYSQMLAANFDGARRSIDEAIRLWPGNARYYAWRGYATSQSLPSQCPRCGATLSAADRQTAREAISDYRHALELNGRDAVAYHNLAWLEHLLGDDAAAGGNWREAAVIDPGNAVFHLSYGMFLDETSGFERARAQYEAVIELSPAILDSPFFGRYRARYPEAAGSMLASCVAKLEARLRQQGDPILEARLGKLYQYNGDFARASALLEDAARRLPNLPRVWLNLGEIREAQGDTAAALDCYGKARVIDGSMAAPYLHMGEISLAAGEKGAATEYFRTAVARWDRANPITAAHNNRLYQGPMQRIDDLLPTTLVWYTTPCEASRAWSGLSKLFPENQKDRSRSRTCEMLPSTHLCSRLE
jgi:tetratricopeptide (TPR) repeat protein